MEAWDARRLDFVAPQLLYLESSSSPREVELRPRGHRRRRDGAAKLGIETPDPELERIADWTDLGLTAYDAAHVAVAEAAGTPLTDDDQIVELAPEVVVALAAFEPPA